MNKAKNKTKLKALIRKFPVYTDLKDLLHHLLLNNIRANYFYFVSGTVTLNSLEELMMKFHNYYSILDQYYTMNFKYKNNKATIKFFLFYDGSSDQLIFLLFARAGINGSRDHLFFDLEKKVKNLRSSKTPLNFLGYQLNKLDDMWTWFISKEYQTNFINELEELIIRKNIRLINQHISKLKTFIGFKGVRADFVKFKDKINLILLQINEADFIHKHKIKLINFDLPLLGQIQTAK